MTPQLELKLRTNMDDSVTRNRYILMSEAIKHIAKSQLKTMSHIYYIWIRFKLKITY